MLEAVTSPARLTNLHTDSAKLAQKTRARKLGLESGSISLPARPVLPKDWAAGQILDSLAYEGSGKLQIRCSTNYQLS